MVANSTVQHSKSNSPTFRSVLSASPVHPHLAPATDVVVTLGDGMCVRTHVRAHALGRARVLGPGLGLGLGHHDTPGDATLTSLRGTADTVEGAEVGLEPVEGVEEEDAVDIDNPPGLVLHRLGGVRGLHADGHQATSVVGTEGVGRGHRHILCVLAARERGLTLALVPAHHVPARGRAPCRTLPTRGTVGARVGAVRVLDP